MAGLRTTSAMLAAAVLLVGAGCGSEKPASAPAPAPAPRLAYADGSAVLVRAADGTAKRVAALPAGWRAEALTWSGDGTELAWIAADGEDVSRSRIYRAAASGSPVRHWDCALLCGGVEFLGSDLVGEGSLGGLESYPASGGEPEPFVPDGLPGASDLLGLSYRNLLTGSPAGDAIYVATGASTAAPKEVYRVGAGPTAVPVQPAGPTGLPLNATVSADGARLAYTVDGAVPACGATESVVVTDLGSGRATTLAPPSSTAAMFVAGLWFGDGDQVFAAYVPGPVPCVAGAAEQPDTPTRATTATVYERAGSTWKAAGRRARDGAHLGAGRALELVGTMTVGPSRIQQSPGGTLRLTGDGAPTVVAEDVTTFAVAPN
ncbi:hypothetical protein [Cryptosporangium arvum]|uniref:Uncharacterized protein n=1 Tax=Cryptosporangium arvum DSM 44712 TaxID=927661 RepID=A0A010ZWG3_9ACTN|nr:hypothetical protein [Cryptosporangium arvum]EXG83009.1 hypothetical protein CryarDRAFT_4215 [Cryptosporangium arvum DSM 44712]